MKITEDDLKDLIKEEVMRLTKAQQDAKIEWLIKHLGEMSHRLTELEKHLGVEWKG